LGHSSALGNGLLIERQIIRSRLNVALANSVPSPTLFPPGYWRGSLAWRGHERWQGGRTEKPDGHLDRLVVAEALFHDERAPSH